MRPLVFACLALAACGSRSGVDALDVPAGPVLAAPDASGPTLGAPDAAASTPGAVLDAASEPPTSPPWEALYDTAQIFTCSAFGCHGGATPGNQGALDLTGPNVSNLIDAPASGSACEGTGWLIVVPGDPARSLLWHKVHDATPPCGAPMLLPNPAADLPLIETWILAGAPHG